MNIYYRKASLYLMLPLSAFFVGVLLFPWHGLHGCGLNMTVNLLIWILVGILGGCLSPLLYRRLWTKRTTTLLFMGLLLLNIPILWTSPAYWPEVAHKLAGTCALAMLLWMLLLLPVRGELRRAIYAVVVFAAFMFALQAVWQVFFPRSAALWLGYDLFRTGGRATGAFGQANLLGSFLATGLLCAIWLMLSSCRSTGRNLAALISVPIFVGLVLSESRSAWLGTAVGVIFLFASINTARHRLQLVSVLAAGLLVGIGSQSLRSSDISIPPAVTAQESKTVRSDNQNLASMSDRLATDRRASGRERLALLKGALSLVATHPLLGNGIGSFESTFPAALLRSGYVNPFPVTVFHPHNEILYVWCEGGLVGLAGLLCWLALWLTPFHPIARTLCRCQRTGSRFVLARGALTLPLMVHTMTEFPFYLSAGHGVLMVVLVWLSLPASARKRCHFQRPPRMHVNFIKMVVRVICLVGIVFMFTGLQSSLCIQAAERQRFKDVTPLTRVVNPFAQPERLKFDLAEENLMRFNTSRDVRWLNRFQQQATAWLTFHNDASFYDAMMRISQAHYDSQGAAYWRGRGCLSFHSDSRFHCES